MSKIYKILGKRGQITIPWEYRVDMGFSAGDVVSFERDGNTVIVRREKICDGCKAVKQPQPDEKTVSLLELLDDLSPAEQRAALIHLSVKWAEMQAKVGGQGA